MSTSDSFAKLYLAGMADHAAHAVDDMNARIESGYRVLHIVSLSGGMLLVVFEKGPPAFAGGRIEASGTRSPTVDVTNHYPGTLRTLPKGT